MMIINRTFNWLLNPETYGPTSFTVKLFFLTAILSLTLLQGIITVFIIIIKGEGIDWYYLQVLSTFIFCSIFLFIRPMIRSLLRMTELKKEFLKNTLIETLLFSSSELDIKNVMVNGNISEDLKKDLLNHDIFLSQNISITEIQDGKWLIIDENRKLRFIAKKEDNKLKIYIHTLAYPQIAKKIHRRVICMCFSIVILLGCITAIILSISQPSILLSVLFPEH